MSAEKRKEDLADLKAFEAALASLVPRADRLDRDRLMFLAGQQSRTGFQPVKETDDNSPLPTNDHASRGARSVPGEGPGARASRWAWPAAFTAMTTVAVVLAVLLAIRPIIPVASPNRPSIAANENDANLPAVGYSQVQIDSPDSMAIDNDLANQLPTTSSLSFLLPFWNTTPVVNGSHLNQPITDNISYPQWRNRILRQGLDAMQLAQTAPRNAIPRSPEPSTPRELLKEYLPDLR
jgi:hypothetical protein